MTDDARPYRPYPWPWGHPGILTYNAELKARLQEEQRRQAGYWLDADLGEENDTDDASDSDYVPSEGSESDASSDSASETDISESEVAFSDSRTTYKPSSPTPSLRALEEEQDLVPQIAELVKEEEAAAAAYDPDEVVYFIRYPPHTDPPVDEQLAVQLGYDPAAIALMHRLPYLNLKINRDRDTYAIADRTSLADYTWENHLKEGRRPYPHPDGCTDIDNWLLPLTIPGRDGWNVMLDTRLGAIRAYCTWNSPPSETVESRRHDELSFDDALQKGVWTEYRRAPLVPAARYFKDLIYAYRSLSRLPVIKPDHNDPNEEHYRPLSYPRWIANQEREEQETLLALYRECGWPDEWRRSDFLAIWKIKKEEIDARAHEAYRAGN
ncbi:hypothetical protein B0H19DRAFT_1248115 [Mycena capillaripes]|nr:hypothetical protein B0H19DRAFT_1248115 [Mycena capillaripes]